MLVEYEEIISKRGKGIKFAFQMLYGEVIIEDAIENMPCFIFAPKTNQCLYGYSTKIG